MTLLAWMIYAVVVTAVIGAAAWVLERSLLALGRPVRLVWALALAASLGVPFLALSGGADMAAPAWVVVASLQEGEGLPGSAAPDPGLLSTQPLLWPGRALGSALTRGLGRAVDLVPFRSVPHERLFSFWFGGAGVLLLLLLAGGVRVHRATGRWPTARIQGETVRIAPTMGPAVIGVTRPRIVLPVWALGLAPERLRLVLLHEREHIDARDTLLLTAATIMVATVFWNPGLWWLLRRLGAALEVDCDRRVLRYGVPPADYGALLIDVGSRSAGLPLPAAALAEPSHLLERRLRHMKRSRAHHPIVGAALAGATALLLVVVACETEAPTTASQDGTEQRLADVSDPLTLQLRERFTIERTGSPDAALLVVDGIVVRGDITEFDLEPDQIASIEVVKGEAARERYGERGRNGVIFITTVDGADPPQPKRLPLLRHEGGSTP